MAASSSQEKDDCKCDDAELKKGSGGYHQYQFSFESEREWLCHKCFAELEDQEAMENDDIYECKLIECDCCDISIDQENGDYIMLDDDSTYCFKCVIYDPKDPTVVRLRREAKTDHLVWWKILDRFQVFPKEKVVLETIYANYRENKGDRFALDDWDFKEDVASGSFLANGLNLLRVMNDPDFPSRLGEMLMDILNNNILRHKWKRNYATKPLIKAVQRSIPSAAPRTARKIAHRIMRSPIRNEPWVKKHCFDFKYTNTDTTSIDEFLLWMSKFFPRYEDSAKQY